MEKGTIIPVWVYTNAQEVELFLNGKSLGKDTPGTKAEEMQCEWMVPYEAGMLEAIAYIDGREVKRASFATAAYPSQLSNTLHTMEAEGGFNTSYFITSESLDEDGNLYPYGENKVYYEFMGDIEKVSLENGNPVDGTSRFHADHRALFFGKTRAVLQELDDARNASVVLASILGDKSLYLSKQITIVAEEMSLIGRTGGGELTILYTTNGDDPTISGKVYEGPFDVEDGSTVKALLMQNGNVLISMEERFGADEGLYWGDEHSEDIWIGRGIFVPAEEAELSGSARATDEGKWFKTVGFVDFDNGEGSITWYQENDGDPGTYKIRIRYAHNDTDSKRPMTLKVNDKLVKTLEFEPSGNWGVGWKFVHAEVTFKSGANNIELKTTGSSGPDIDELFID
jgi:beta-galactosidase